MRNKIIQLNNSAKDKLTQLNIFQHRKDAYSGIPEFEESLATILSQVPIHANHFLITLLEHSRKRFLEEVDSDIQNNPEQTKRRNFEGVQSLNTDINLRKMIVYKGSSPMASSKANPFEDGKGRESLRRRNIEPSGTPKRDLSKVGRSPMTTKSIDNRPSFDFREESLKPVYDMSGVINKVNTMILAKEGVVDGETGNENEQLLTSVKEDAIRTMTPRQENVLTGINLNNSTSNNDKSLSFAAAGSNISSRVSSVKKVKISSSNNKKSICIEEPVDPAQAEKDKSQIRASKEAWKRNYDILKIEDQQLPIASKKETKKLLLEKIYNQLLGTNNDIKRTIKYYHNNYQNFSVKKQSEEGPENQEEEDIDEIEPVVINSETSRPKSLTVQGSPNITAVKGKQNKLTPNQRNLISIENLKEIMNCELGSDGFNVFGSNSMSITTKNSKDSNQKKNTSQKFLILPKLNINSDNTHSQNLFPSWPVSSMQGTKAMAKNNNFGAMDFATKHKYEKALQKGSERLLQNLILDTKQDLAEQDAINLTLANNRRNNKGYLNFSNKNAYPMALQKLDPSTVINKPIGF